MSTTTLPNIRVSSDLTVRVRLKDGGVYIDWSTLNNIKAHIYSDAQRALAGRCDVSVDAEDSTLLVCSYAANKPQYVGINRIVVSAKYMGETKTYDKPAFNFVRWTADQEGEEITIDDPDVDVEIEVEDVTSSILQEAIDAALQAAADAEHAAHLVPLEVLQDCEQATADALEAAATANAAGIDEVQATVDAQVGTPSVDVDLENKVLSLDFHNMKGETGEAAGFGTASASLTEDGGDPGVTVSASGPDTAKQFAFTFKNLKGDKGDKGDQGNTGSSVDYPYELVNNCTTDDATKGLAASQGVALAGQVSQLEAEVGESERVEITYTDDYFVNTNGTSANVENPTSSSSWRYALVPCSPGEKFTVSGRTTSATVAAIWCFLDSSYNILSRVASDATEISDVSLTAPANTAYLLLNDNKSGAVSYEGMTLREIVNAQGNEIDNIPTVIDGVVDSKIGRYEDIVTVWSDGAINSSGGVDSTDYFEHSDFIPKSKYGAIRSYTKLTTARLVVVFFQEDKSTVVGYKSIADYGVESNEWATFNIAWIDGAAYCKVNRAAGAGSTLKGYTSVIQDVAALEDSINVVRFDTRLSEFRLELLPVGSYVGNDGQIYTSTTPPYRGTARLEIEPNTELYVPGASYYLLYKDGGTLTNLVAMPTDKKVIVPVGAKSIVFDCPPLSVEYLDIIVKKNAVNPSKLWLLPIGQYYGSDGTIYETGAWRGTSKVSVSEGDKIRVPLAAYYLTWNGATLVRGLTAPPANKIITIPSGVDSIAFDISPNDDLKEIEIEYLPNIDENHAQWKGRQWYAFGCSISDTGPLDNGHTETGTYPAFLVGMSGLVHHNWAWGGSCIADRARTNSDGQHPTAVQRIDAAIEEGSIANADLITIDGAYNDYGANVPLGEITDKEDGNNNDSTFFMALYQAVMKLKTVAPNARIVFLTDNTGQTTQQQGDISEYYHKNSVQGLFQRDYQKAMIEFANFVGVSVIDCGGKSGISSIHPQYLADHIHQSQLGGLQFAQTIWDELKEMQLMKR